MKLHVINDLYYKDNHAGYKARNDIFEIIKSDFSHINIYNFYKIEFINSKNRWKKALSRRHANYFNYFTFKKFSSSLGSEDVVMILVPFESLFKIAKAVYKQLHKAKRKNGIKIIIMIIDLDSIRRTGQIEPEEEISYLDYADVIISQNQSMTGWLVNHGIKREKITNLNFFDFLINPQHQMNLSNSNESSKNIIYGGNLNSSKAGFIYKWKPNFNIKLYGIHLDKQELPDNIQYLGVFDPSMPTMDVSGISFGLVWDGDSTETCTGLAGQYLKYSTPHKASLYVAQGLPLIVWEQSALAHFVKENNIGITVSNLDEIQGVLDNIQLEEYNQIKSNVNQIREKIIKGKYFITALENSIILLDNHILEEKH